ncbi:uncharacterized protein LOC131679486 [Topomyia yanbarensis]|uniref:uncharacterized protein LOC131679486 n=1 Tax=Topomyia yanbarensis TaxID=2498891 RepID=UPI00273C84A5|nr:uncharacterized protein LOC131679486 [Topomyia yanbarensis]
MAITFNLIGFLLLVVSLKDHQIGADGGLPGSISSNAKSINGTLKKISQSFRKYSSVGQTERLRVSGDLIAEITNNVTHLGKMLTGNVSKAADDKSVTVDELFLTLHNSYDQMSRYLQSDVQVLMYNLNSTVGSSYASELIHALSSVNDAILNITNVTRNVENAIGTATTAANGKPLSKEVINDSIPSNITTSLSEALLQMKDQMVMLSRALENTLRNMGQVNSFLAKLSSASQAVEQKLNSSQTSIENDILDEQANVLKKYSTYQTNIKNELNSAIGKLSRFSTNRSLQTLVDQYGEEYTIIYYYLFNRSETDAQSITNAFSIINSNIRQQIQTLSSDFKVNLERISNQLVDLYLSRKDNIEYCFGKPLNQIFNHLTNFQTALITCMNREETRVERIGEAIERILQLSLSNSQEFANNIASCTTYVGFEKSVSTFEQAKICLITNLDYMTEFQTVIGQELNGISMITTTEIAASKFRLNNCMVTRHSESIAAIDGLNSEIEQCVSGEGARGLSSADRRVELIEAHTTVPVNDDQLANSAVEVAIQNE